MIEGSINTWYLPSFPQPIPPNISGNEVDNVIQEGIAQLENILTFLSNTRNEIEPPKIREIQIPCDNSLLKWGVNILANITQIAFDTITCGYGSCMNREPECPVYVTEEIQRSIMDERISISRNTTALCCVGPIVSITVPIITTAPPSVLILLAITNNITGLIITGCMTYHWSDSTKVEQHAYEELKRGFDLVAGYLENKWNSGNDLTREELKIQCGQIAENYDLIEQGIMNQGISPQHATDSLTKLSDTVRKIRFAQI